MRKETIMRVMLGIFFLPLSSELPSLFEEEVSWCFLSFVFRFLSFFPFPFFSLLSLSFPMMSSVHVTPWRKLTFNVETTDLSISPSCTPFT
jgi:hypothetical protein